MLVSLCCLSAIWTSSSTCSARVVALNSSFSFADKVSKKAWTMPPHRFSSSLFPRDLSVNCQEKYDPACNTYGTVVSCRENAITAHAGDLDGYPSRAYNRAESQQCFVCRFSSGTGRRRAIAPRLQAVVGAEFVTFLSGASEHPAPRPVTSCMKLVNSASPRPILSSCSRPVSLLLVRPVPGLD